MREGSAQGTKMPVETRRSASVASGHPARDVREAILVLGMHRSGTSAFAGTLARLGARPPRTLMAATSANESGYYESVALMLLHEEILEANRSTWHDWRPLRRDWFATEHAARLRRKARALFAEEFGDARLSLLKDPRVCRFVPFWSAALAEDGIVPKAVIPFRAPIAVARSLHKRDRMSIEEGLLMWLRHVLDAEHQSRDLARAFVDLGDFLADWRASTERIAGAISVTWPRDRAEAAAEVDAFLVADLQHHGASQADLAQLHPWAARIYRALKTLAKEPDSESARGEFDAVRTAFDDACALLGPLVRDRSYDPLSWRLKRRLRRMVG